MSKKNEAKVENRFKLVNTFDIVVPKGYDHSKCLPLSQKKHRRVFFYYNHFVLKRYCREFYYHTKVTTKLKPGRKLKVKVFQMKVNTITYTTSEDCLAHLRSQKAILVGTQGALLAWEQKKEELPNNGWVVSFDKKDKLWKDPEGIYRVPLVYQHLNGKLEFLLGDFECEWNGDHDGYIYILCFNE